jgi:hypothetical protein
MSDRTSLLHRTLNIGRACRDAQRRFLESRSRNDLRVMRDWERRFDAALAACERQAAEHGTPVSQ